MPILPDVHRAGFGRQLPSHLACDTAGGESVDILGGQMADTGGSGAFQREEQKQSTVPMEAAEEHFHLMPSRPSVEDEVISG